jgi:hypothetical protein
MALPTRTMVLPLATAASRSALMPIDRVSKRSPAAFKASKRPLALLNTALGSFKIRSRLRNAHQPAQRNLGNRHTACAKASLTPDLVGPPSTLTCRHTCRVAGGRALLAQALRDFQAVHRMHPVKVLGHQPGLVALDRADAVPLQRQGGWRSAFCPPLPGCSFHQSGLARHRMGHAPLRDQRSWTPPAAPRCRVAPCSAGRRLHARAHALEIVGNHRHNGRERNKRARDPWTLPNCWPSASRTRHPICTCRPGCHR